MLFKRKQKQEVVALQDVKTLLNSGISGHDENNDGIPDYRQRPEIPSLLKSNKDLNQWEADVTMEIETWIMGLRGYEFDPSNNVYKPVSPPTINEIGIRKIRTHLQTIVNKHSINTALKIEEAHKICEYHTSTLIRWFKHNAKKCEVANSDLSPIIAEFDNFAFIVLSRAVEDGQRKHTTDRTKLTGHLSPPAQTASFP